MIKNKLYPYIEEYINSYLYGFTKEQLDVGLMNGQIKLENLNLRPDGVNDTLDQSNTPFWLKAGLIAKINLGCSLMNFIGEKPIEVNIEGINIIITPSYKWIIQNLDSFIYEDLKEMKSEYVAYENNSVNIFSKRINVLDNSVFNRRKIEEFFKDQTKISNLLNKILLDCFEYYYSKNYSLILKLKNIHIRFEDDQLINYMGDIALGCKIDLFELTLSSEGNMKKNNFKITNLDLYWENNANILIPSNILYDSIKNGVLNDSYYTNLKKIKFENYSYKSDSKFIIKNLNCLSNFGTKIINQGKMDLFSKKENNYKLYIQFASNEININIFPDLNIIRNNLRRFIKEFSIIGQAQEFKPMKKPYNWKNSNFIEIVKFIKNKKNSELAKIFSYKRKMMVRDWLFYFYWCHKCKSSIYEYDSNPLKSEFTRFYNLVYKNNGLDTFSEFEKESERKKSKDKIIYDENNKPIWSRENPNPDNINLIFNIDIKLKGLNIHLYPFISSKDNNDCISIKINGLDSKILLSKNKFELSFNVKNLIFGPNKLNMGEKVIIKRRRNSNSFANIDNSNVNSFDKNANYKYNNYLTSNDIDSNMGINGLLKKYNPNLNQQLNILDKAMKTINKGNNDTQSNHNVINSERNNGKKNFDEKENSLNTFNTYRENQFAKNKNNNFTKNLINNYEPNPTIQKMELNRQKNEFNISQAINQYNNTKSFQKYNTVNNMASDKTNISSIPYPKKSNNSFYQNNNSSLMTNNTNCEMVSTGQNTPLNLIEIYSDNNNTACLNFKYIKTNNNSSLDIIRFNLGIIRINFFNDYIIKCANILNDYKQTCKKITIKSIKNNLSELENDFNTEKQLFEMKKYFLEKLNKLPEKQKTKQIQSYMTYLKTEIEKGNKKYNETDNIEINYLFNIFSNGIDINFNYDNFECIYYNNKNNKICGKANIPSPMFNFKINSSNISFKLYDFELEIDDLENIKLLFKALHTIMENKFKMVQLLIEPCLIQIKNDIEKKEQEIFSLNNEKNHDLKNLNKLIVNNMTLNNRNDNKDKEIVEKHLKEEYEKKIPKKEIDTNANDINKKKELIPIPQKTFSKTKDIIHHDNKNNNSESALNSLNNKENLEKNKKNQINKKKIFEEKNNISNKIIKKNNTDLASHEDNNKNNNNSNSINISQNKNENNNIIINQNECIQNNKDNKENNENTIKENHNEKIIKKKKSINKANSKSKENLNEKKEEKKSNSKEKTMKVVPKEKTTTIASKEKIKKEQDIGPKKKCDKSKKPITKKKLNLNIKKK